MTSSEVLVLMGRHSPETSGAPAGASATRLESNFPPLSLPLAEMVFQSVVRILPSSDVVNLFVATTFLPILSANLDAVIVHFANALRVSVGCAVVQ